MYIVRDTLNDSEQAVGKVVVDQHQLLWLQPLHARHLVHELQQKTVQARVLVISPRCYQLQESRETSLLNHARIDGLVIVPIQQQQRRDGV